MTNGEAVNWIINISADIGKAEHRDLWHYEQALSEIKEMLESQPERKGKWIDGRDERFVKCSECGMESTKNALMGIALFGEKEPHFCPNCGSYNGGEEE